MNKKRLTIGLLVGNIDDNFSNSVCKGAIDAAEKLDANLVVLPGRYIGIDYETLYKSRYEYQFNTLFSCVADNNVDVVIAAVGSIAYDSTAEDKLKFLEKYAGIPVITIAEKVGDYPCVKYDNSMGIADAVNHLVNAQGRKRIGMLAGNMSNSDVVERLQAYKDALAANGLPFEKKLVSYGQLSGMCVDAADKLLNENPDIDAILCSNDAMARTLYDVLRERGVMIGDMIAVVGFDDLPYSITLTPPLATVRASAERLGCKAVELCVSVKLGCKDIDDLLVETKFIPRQSCGSMDYEINRLNTLFAGSSADNHAALTDEITSMLITGDSEFAPEFGRYKSYLDKVVESVYKYFVEGTATIQDIADILGFIDKALETSPKGYVNEEMIKSAVEMLYSFANENLNYKGDNLELLNKLYALTYKSLSDDYSSRLQRYNEVTADFIVKMNLFMRDMLMFSNTFETSYATILKQLHTMSVRYSLLILYDKPYVNELSAHWQFPEEMYLKSVQDNREIIAIPPTSQPIVRRDLFNNMFIPSDRRITLFGTPLFSNEQQFGIFLCEMEHKDTKFLELITYQLSAAVKIIGLLRQQSESLSRLYDDNAELDAITKIDELTGLLNRRGFYKYARERFAEAKIRNKIGVVAYVDTDYLKIINDRFGHNEGDVALKATAEILEKTFRQSDVLGRVGGDEYIAFAMTDRMGFGDIIRARLHDALAMYNASAIGKGYNLSLSIGIYEFRCNSNSTLEHAVEMADDFLYRSKKSRPVDFSIIRM